MLAVLGLLGGAQIILPGVAEQRVRDSLGRWADGLSVTVSATPAVRLLFGHADHVGVRIARLRLPGAGSPLADLLVRTRQTDDLDVRVATLVTHGLVIRDVYASKRGLALSAEGTLSKLAIEAVLPFNLRLGASAQSGQSLLFSATATILGQPITGSALLVARDGNLEIAPNLPLLSALHVNLFSDPRVAVDRISLVTAGDAYTFSVAGHLVA